MELTNSVKVVEGDIIVRNTELNGKDIIDYYYLEEAGELQKEIIKGLRGNLNMLHLVEEMADVYYTLSMLRQKYSITDDEINECIRDKERQAYEKLKRDSKK